MGKCISNFTGRHEEINDIYDQLTCVDGNNQGVVITGGGGIGKTELTLRLCQQFKPVFVNIIWINADTKSSIETSYFELAEHLQMNKSMDIKTLINQVNKYLTQKDTLLIFDNLKNEDVVSAYLPKCISISTMRYLITSQSNDWSSDFTKYPLEVFSPDVSCSFIKDNISSDSYDEDSTKAFTCKLGCHPLALQLSISYIKKHGLPTGEFNKLLTGTLHHFINKPFSSRYGKNIHAAFSIALQELSMSENDHVVPLLYLLAFLDGRSIARELLMHVQRPAENSENVKKALKEIEDYSFIRKKSEGHNVIYTMHSLMQEILQDDLLSSTRVSLSGRTKFTFLFDIMNMLKYFELTLDNKAHTSYGKDWCHHLLLLYEKYYTSNVVVLMMEDMKGQFVLRH